MPDIILFSSRLRVPYPTPARVKTLSPTCQLAG
jgi:hypothetical protein